MNQTIIRPSYLSQYPDCARRTAARIFWPLVTDAGFRLNRTKPNIGAATGTATHKVAAVTLKAKMKTGELANGAEAEQAGLESLDQEIASGVSWDATSPNLNTAQKQVVRQSRVYRKAVAAKIMPSAVEERLEAVHHASGFLVSGQQDVVVTSEAEFRDLKTGVNRWPNAAQYGAYAMLLKAHGTPVLRIIEDYVRRTRAKDAQPDPEEIKYDVEKSMAVASTLLVRIRQDLDTYIDSGEPELAFIANRNSILCGAKFCLAWQTDWCPESRL